MSDVRVGIVAWNVAEHLDRCLSALPAALSGLHAEVVVVDNASADASADVAAAHAGVTVIRSPSNTGYARGMNRALTGTDAPVLIALNPDTIPPPGSLATLVASLQTNPDVGLVAPLLLDEDGGIQHSVHRFPTLTLAAVANLLPWRLLPRRVRDALWLPGAVRPDRTGHIDWAIGAVHVIRRAALPDTAPYRERWFIYVEDVDLCWRLTRAGWQIRFEAGVAIPHTGGASAVRAFGTEQRLRWLGETYDWFGLVHGAGRARVYAALNLVGEAARGLAAAVRASRTGSGAIRTVARRRGGPLRVHLRTVVHGPPSPAPPLS